MKLLLCQIEVLIIKNLMLDIKLQSYNFYVNVSMLIVKEKITS